MTDQERYERDKASILSMIRFILMALIIVAVCFLGTKIVIILIPFLIGFILSKCAYGLASPLVDFAAKLSKSREDVSKVKRKVATVFYYILLLLIAVACTYIIYELIAQVTNATTAIVNYAATFNPATLYEDLMSYLSKVKLDDDFASTLQSIIGNFGTEIVSKVPGILSGIITSLWNAVGNIPYGIFVVVCVIFSGHYFINDTTHIMKFFSKVIPHKDFRVKLFSVVDNLSTTLFRALGGYIVLFIITSIEAYVFLRFANVKYALILAIVTGLIDFMPVLGISATMIPVMVYCFFHGNYKAIIILVIGMAVMTVVRRLIEPPILGKSLHLHPLLMLVSMAGGVYIWGAIGFLLGPTVVIIFLDVFKVFGFDKKATEFITRVLSNFVPEEQKKSDKHSHKEKAEIKHS